MSVANVTIPPRLPGCDRSQVEHEAIYLMFIVEGLSGSVTAAKMMERFPGTKYTRESVGSYSHRNGWAKGAPDSHGRIPPPDAPSTKLGIAKPGDLSAILADLDPRDQDGRLAMGAPQCRWPAGPSPRGRMELQLFCGEASHGDFPYCWKHCCKAYPAFKGRADAAKD